MACPCAEMSTGSHQMWLAKIAVETSAMIATTTANNLPMGCSVRPGFEHKIHGLGLAAADGYVLRLGSELFLPRRERVLARREPLQAELAILTRHRIVRGREHQEPAVHPRVHVAFDRNELRLLPRGVDRRGSNGLRLVPLGVYLRERVDVVRRLIVVVDLERLVHPHDGDVRDVLATLLVIPHRFA